jgi:hypothetical protein
MAVGGEEKDRRRDDSFHRIHSVMTEFRFKVDNWNFDIQKFVVLPRQIGMVSQRVQTRVKRAQNQGRRLRKERERLGNPACQSLFIYRDFDECH